MNLIVAVREGDGQRSEDAAAAVRHGDLPPAPGGLRGAHG